MKKEIEQSYVCRLRTLTEKSKIGFGYEEMKNSSVRDLIISNKVKFLIQLYYNLDKISFVPEILDELGIIEENRILKPGKASKKDSAIYIKKALAIYSSKLTSVERLTLMKSASSKHKQKKIAATLLSLNLRRLTRSKMSSKLYNEGHGVSRYSNK